MCLDRWTQQVKKSFVWETFLFWWPVLNHRFGWNLDRKCHVFGIESFNKSFWTELNWNSSRCYFKDPGLNPTWGIYGQYCQPKGLADTLPQFTARKQQSWLAPYHGHQQVPSMAQLQAPHLWEAVALSSKVSNKRLKGEETQEEVRSWD